MKNKTITCLSLLLLIPSCLLSCNKERKLNTINEESAIKLAKEINARQNDTTSFRQPSWFTYKSNYTCEYNAKLYDVGSINTSTKIYEECLFNIDDLIIKTIYNREEKDTSSNIETYIYFDGNNNQIITLTNTNGRKRKKIKSVRSKDYAIIYFKNLRDEYKLINDDCLINFESNINTLKTKQEEIKDKKDQYINLYYGSNDDNSLQLIVDEKLEDIQSKSAGSTTYNLTGYKSTKTSDIYTLDLTDYKLYSYNEDIKNNDLGFYIKDEVKKEEQYTYGKVNITLPNIDEYKEN